MTGQVPVTGEGIHQPQQQKIGCHQAWQVEHLFQQFVVSSLVPFYTSWSQGKMCIVYTAWPSTMHINKVTLITSSFLQNDVIPILHTVVICRILLGYTIKMWQPSTALACCGKQWLAVHAGIRIQLGINSFTMTHKLVSWVAFATPNKWPMILRIVWTCC